MEYRVPAQGPRPVLKLVQAPLICSGTEYSVPSRSQVPALEANLIPLAKLRTSAGGGMLHNCSFNSQLMELLHLS